MRRVSQKRDVAQQVADDGGHQFGFSVVVNIIRITTAADGHDRAGTASTALLHVTFRSEKSKFWGTEETPSLGRKILQIGRGIARI